MSTDQRLFSLLAERLDTAARYVEAGVTVTDPLTTYIEPSVSIGRGTVIEPNTTLSGATTIGADCRIGPNTVIDASSVGDRCTVFASVVRDSTLEDDVHAGPFCHVRGSSHLGAGVRLGTSAEVNRSRLGKGSKSNHFSYVGDAEVGEGVNIGAGTVTCNYDGENKNKTVIEDGVFIGSDSMLVAPVRIGKGAQTGAGSVVTKDVPPGGRVAGVPAKPIGDSGG
jgi:bifunctional UDP-N-acetylglucosamine pyrophosphorylase/glucosamine-1-phosphate N-acetyltransferase